MTASMKVTLMFRVFKVLVSKDLYSLYSRPEGHIQKHEGPLWELNLINSGQGAETGNGKNGHPEKWPRKLA